MNKSLKTFLKAAFPGQYELLRDGYIHRKRLQRKREEYEKCRLPERACHLHGLFIRHDGGVYPCCLIWNDPDMRIGHINDPDIYEKIAVFQEQCYCKNYKLRKTFPGEKASYELLNIEVSLACQGKCVMCCVGAPDWHGEYNYYDEVTRILERCKPERIVIQGGEVLIQKKTLEWLHKTRKRFSTEFSLVTNGNAGMEMIDVVEDLFDEVCVSIVGFEPETYRKTMGMEMSATIRFCEELAKRGKVRVYPKYLMTPTGIHESDLFLNWAISTGFKTVFLAEADIISYLNMETPDQFWQKIIDRTGQDVRAMLIKNRNKMMEKRVVIDCESAVTGLFGITDEFIAKNGLEGIVVRSERGMGIVKVTGLG